MATKGQTHAKRDRERALRERRERKRAKRVEAAAQRAAEPHLEPGPRRDAEHVPRPGVLDGTALRAVHGRHEASSSCA